MELKKIDLKSLVQFYNKNKGGINGALVGLVIAILTLILGFIKMLFLAFCVGLGYYIGKKVYEDKDYFKNLLDKFLPPGSYR